MDCMSLSVIVELWKFMININLSTYMFNVTKSILSMQKPSPYSIDSACMVRRYIYI